jgi:hypothetical protein
MSDMQIPLFDPSDPPASSSQWNEQALDTIPLHKEGVTTAADLVPEDAIFRITNNYDISSGDLSRFLSFFRERQAETIKSLHRTLAAELAIPSVKVPTLMNFSRRTELLIDGNKLTTLAQIYLKHDQYLLNTGGLWLLHFLISSNSYAASWCRLFNSISYEIEDLSPTELVAYYRDLQGNQSEKMFTWNGGKEMGAILRTYSDSLFKPLGMIVRIDTGHYAIITDEFDIPPLIWLSSILAYRDRFYPGAASLETQLIVDAHFSPGRLFRQKEERIRQVLDTLHSQGLITMETRLGLDQVRFKREGTWTSAIARYFEEGK